MVPIRDPSSKTTELKDVHYQKAVASIISTFAGIVIDVSAVQL